MELLRQVFLLILSLATGLLIIPYLAALLQAGGLNRKNYQGRLIPVGTGIGIVPTMLLAFFPLNLLANYDLGQSYIFLSAVVLMAFIGFMDDTLGNRDTLGLKGHVGALLKGNLTTGGLKLLTGGLTALGVSLALSDRPLDRLLNALLIALMTNFINLMDLRPGRALKVFIFFGTITLFLPLSRELRYPFLVLLGYTLALLPMDLRGAGMLGDTGANPLGIALGILLAVGAGLILRLVVLVLLIGIHLVAEKVSLSEIIERNPVLNFLDQLGRGQQKDVHLDREG